MFCNKCGNKIEEGMKFCKICGAPIINTQTSSSSSDNKKKTNNTIIKIVSLVVVFAILICGLPSVIFAVKNSKETKGENITYVSEVLIIKNHVDFKVLDEEKFPVDEYEVKVEQYVIGGVLKAISAKNEIFTETSSETTYTLDLDDGDYRITFIETVEVETQSETTEKVDPLTVVMDVKVDNDNENALDTVDFILLPTEEIKENKDDKSESSSEFIEASDADFEELKTILPIIYPINFNCTTLKTDFFVDDMITPQGWLSTLYMYYFEGYPSEDVWGKEEKYCCTEPDPKRMFTDYDDYSGYYSYLRIPKKNLKWLCEDAFNAEFDENYVSDNSYVYGDYVYRGMGGRGGQERWEWDEYDITESPVIDGKYQITVKHYFCYDDVNGVVREHLSTKQITAKIKTKDNGERFWSFYEIKEI